MRKTRLWCVILSFLLLFLVANTFGQFGSPVPRYPHEVDGLVNMRSRQFFSQRPIFRLRDGGFCWRLVGIITAMGLFVR